MANGRFTAKKEKRALPVKKIALVTGAVLGALALCVGGFFGIRAITDPLDNRIAEGVTIGGLEVGGMKKSEAKQALSDALDATLYTTALTVELPDESFSLSPAALQFRVDVNRAIQDAYAIGRKVSTEDPALELTPYLTMNDAAIHDALRYYAQTYDTDLTPASFGISGSTPKLGTAEYDPEAPCQTVTITKGKPDYHLDQDAVYALILDAYNNAIGLADAFTVSFRYEADALPEDFDLDGFYAEHCIEAVDDSLDMQTYQLVNGSYGYAFDLEEAKKLLSLADYGESIELPMAYTEPEILGDGVYFRDVLGTCETKHNTNENRNTNLRILCEALNGKIIQPGEEFSYNECLGERTEEKGYKPAPAYSGSRLVDSVGGGVCQGSSTLYNCVLLADLEVVTRLCHGATVSYLPIGLDAAVNWGTTDFVFRNNWNFPVKIEAEVSDGYVKMKILGTDEKDYYIKMTSGYDDSHDGYITAVSYKNKYSKETDELISKEREAFSTYYTNIG